MDTGMSVQVLHEQTLVQLVNQYQTPLMRIAMNTWNVICQG